MADLLEHVMINKLGDDLDEAITYVGGDTTSVRHISQYPDIIREQLSANGITLDKSIILEGDSCVIIADETGRDEYNTEYAMGVKTGLNPGAYYIRICTAVKDIEPVYIDLTPVTELIGGGVPGDLDIDKIVNMVINSPTMQNNYVSNQEFTNLETTVNEFQTDITEVQNNVTNLETTVNEFQIDINEVQNNVTNLETTVNEFQTDINEVQNNVTNLETTVNEFQTDITEVQNNVTNLETTVNEFQTDITEVQNNVTNLETTVNEFQTDINEVQNNVTNLETTVSELLNPTDSGGLDEEETDSFFE